MNAIFNHTHGDITGWASEIKKYQNDRKSLQWGPQEKPKLITYRQVKEKDDEFNPILQTFRNKEQENLLKKISSKEKTDILAKNKDNALRIEQTYDLLTLENKIGLLEPEKPSFINTFRDGNIDYNKYTKVPRAKSNIIKSKVNYNILSNISLNKHSSIHPDLRQDVMERPSPKRIQIINANYYKDYDIISNKYKEFNQEKTKFDKEIAKVETKTKYNKLHDYNLITAEVYDQKNEIDSQIKRDVRIKQWQNNLNKKSKYFTTGYLYNPINMSVINESGLREADNTAKNKKKRYELRNIIEIHRHTTEEEKFKQNQEKVMSKISYNRFKTFDERGFSILNQDEKIDKNYKELNPKCKDIKNDWDKLIQNVGNKKLIEKNVYKEQYDCDNLELAKTSKQFILNRKSIFSFYF